MKKIRLATAWLDACSGCHMSFLDMDEELIPLADMVELVSGPLVDFKGIPKDVDVYLVTGAISTDEDIHKIKEIRANTRILVALGDCAVNSNVPSMRNQVGPEDAMERAYVENATEHQGKPCEKLPHLLCRVRPLHEVVKVDEFIQGCPPSAELIHFILVELLHNRIPGRGIRTKFG